MKMKATLTSEPLKDLRVNYALTKLNLKLLMDQMTRCNVKEVT